MKRQDIFLGLYILVPVVFLIVPIPTLLLDILILFNIGIALVILFNSLFSKEALNMSIFPTLLLMTTLFRMSLNVSSTRNILLHGYAGNVVETFGQFVGGGNLVVGMVIFFILIIIQFIVINKGSERVSEVTARFTLDAMPGKQMAIDADLNTGAIDDAEAKRRREKIQERRRRKSGGYIYPRGTRRIGTSSVGYGKACSGSSDEWTSIDNFKVDRAGSRYSRRLVLRYGNRKCNCGCALG